MVKHDSAKWSALDDQMTKWLGAGRSHSFIAAELGIDPEAVRSRVRRLRKRGITPPRTLGTLPPDDRDPFYDLSPIHLPALTISPPRVMATDASIVAGDFHFPLHDPRCISIFLQVVRDLRPRLVVLNGDMPDMLAISRYPKDPRYSWSLLDERVAYHQFLRELFAITSTIEGCRVVETDANHSGNGIESRWWRFLSERIGELASLPEIIEKLDYSAIWHPQEEWCKLESVPYIAVSEQIMALHGDVVRGKAAYSASAMLDKWQFSLIHGHTHRSGMTSYRVPPIMDRPERILRAFEGGCMCQLTAHYAQVVDWSQGFTIVRGSGEHFGVEQVIIENGHAVVTSVGAVYHAE